MSSLQRVKYFQNLKTTALKTYHALGETAKANGGEKVDGETSVGRIITWHESVKSLLKSRIIESVIELGHAHVLGQFLEENLDKDPGRACGL